MTEPYSFPRISFFLGGLFSRYVKLDCVVLLNVSWQAVSDSRDYIFVLSRSVYYCELCESNCSGEKQLDQHLR